MNRQFTALSGIAMALIVLNHAIELAVQAHVQAGAAALPAWAEMFLSVLQSLGVFAVPIFLFISGSFVAYAAQGDPPRLTFKFIYTSLRHLLVPYLIWSLLFYLLIYFHRGDRYTPFEYLKFLLVGYPFHFIPLLVLFYALSPLLVKVARRTPVLLILAIVAYQILLLNLVYPASLGFAFPAWMSVFAPPILRQTFADWGVFFPLGLVYGLHTARLLPQLRRLALYFWLLTASFFVVGVFGRYLGIHFVLARHICMLTFVFTLPAISRDSIPWVKFFDRIGRRSYGVYLLHLIVIDLVLFGVASVVPAFLNLLLVLLPLLFLLGLLVPVWIMERAAKGPLKKSYRLIFG